MKLYLYDHCPFCVKARMIFGFTQTPVTEIFLLNDDEQTPISMIGKKMLPILVKEDGSFLPESLDIVHYIDGLTGQPSVFRAPSAPEIKQWLDAAEPSLYRLVMPRNIQYSGFEEFATQSAKDYFQHNKEKFIGSFALAWAKTDEYLADLNQRLVNLEPMIKSAQAMHGELSEDDLHLFAFLRCLSLVKGVHYPAKVREYMQQISSASRVPLLWENAL